MKLKQVAVRKVENNLYVTENIFSLYVVLMYSNLGVCSL